MIWDPNFRRTVILLCETSLQGSFGLIINRPISFESDEISALLNGQSPALFLGGPVQPDTLHYVHDLVGLIEGGTALGNGVIWGGDFESVQAMAMHLDIREQAIRFFLGYSGWGEGQLEDELARNDWIVAPLQRKFVFETAPEEMWSAVISSLGGEYKLFANFPADPRMN